MKFTLNLLATSISLFGIAQAAAIPNANAEANALAVGNPAPLIATRTSNLASRTEQIEKRNSPKSYTTGTALKHTMLNWHNAYRAHHGSVNVTWSTTLARAALKNAKACVFAHSNPYVYGENLAGGSLSINNPAYYVALWYNEVNSYNYSKPGYSDSVGHFTQVIWNATTHIGCAFVQGCTGSTKPETDNMLTCEYYPNGNVLPDSNFAVNVGTPLPSPALPAAPPYST